MWWKKKILNYSQKYQRCYLKIDIYKIYFLLYKSFFVYLVNLIEYSVEV